MCIFFINVIVREFNVIISELKMCILNTLTKAIFVFEFQILFH